MAIWFDVDDLVAYFNAHRRPSGIQRLCFELYREIWDLAGDTGQIRFCRHNAQYSNFVAIDWPTLERAIAEVTAQINPDVEALVTAPDETECHAPPAPAAPRAPAALRWLAKTACKLELRVAMGEAYYSSPSRKAGILNALRAGVAYFGLVPGRRGRIDHSVIDAAQPTPMFREGDVLVALGSLWDPRFAPLLTRLRHEKKIRFAVMFYDLIPDLFPEYTGESLTALFRNWLYTVLPQADVFLTISKASASDLKSAMARLDNVIPEPVVLPMGGHRQVARAGVKSPFNRKFVLFVSTIEPRKNHELMLAVWENLLATMPAEHVPDLVFAGRVIGDIAEVLSARIRHPGLRERLKIVAEPEDERLAQLYQHCLFTVFPSFYEGWGLPVTESLSFGKTVAASNRASLPEAGGDFCVYYDPENLTEATKVIRGLIASPRQVARLEARIGTAFRPPNWTESARLLLRTLQVEPARQAAGVAAVRRAGHQGVRGLSSITPLTET